MPSLTSLKQLQYLVALSEHLHFTRAAESCFVSQSTLSAGLKELEDLLDARLVERDRQTVIMTPVGIEIAKRARVILAAAQDLVEAATSGRTPMTGLIRFGVIPTIAPFLLPQALRIARSRYPRLKIALREDLTASLIARLEEGKLDLALIALPYDTGNLLVEPLFDDALWILGRKDDAALKPRRVSLDALVSERLLLLEEGHCLREHVLYACGSARPNAAHGLEATSLLTQVQMIESGLGLGLIPDIAMRSGLASAPDLIARPLAEPAPKRTLALVARRSTLRQREMNALAALLKSQGPSKTRGAEGAP
jgi:LysR family hydrogen peroxide-inducible transcriptional activator